MNPVSRATPAGRAYLDLQNRARREGRGTQEYLTAYVVERWLARLSRSSYASQFVLKGGVLLAAFGQRRPTVDADALAIGIANDAETVAARVAEIAAIEDPEDGVEYLAASIATQVIRDHALYHGVRVVMDARIATAVVKLRLPVVVVILNNGGLGMVRQWQSMFYERRLSQVDLSAPTDCALVARGFGALGFSVHDEAELDAALAAALACGRAAVLDVHVEHGEACFPMIPPGAAAVDMLEWHADRSSG